MTDTFPTPRHATIVSSCYGDYDQPAPPTPQDIDVDWVMVTDNPDNIPQGWRVVHEPRPHMHPRLAAKVAKCRPDQYTDADVTIWIDASIIVNTADFATWCLDWLRGYDIAQIRHPERQSIIDEAHVSSQMAKYAGQPVFEQVEHYSNLYRTDWGLWATGLIVRRSIPHLYRFGDAWLREQVRWTFQDQLSESPMLQHFDITPNDLPGPLWRNPRFTVRGHRSDQ